MVWGQGAVNVGQRQRRDEAPGSNYPQKPLPSPFHMRRLGATEVGCALLCFHYSLDRVGSLPSLNKTPTDNLEFASSEAGAKLEGLEHVRKSYEDRKKPKQRKMAG